MQSWKSPIKRSCLVIFAVIADGDSMIGAGIHPGDRVIIRPQSEVESGEIALVTVEGGSTIKRFYK